MDGPCRLPVACLADGMARGPDPRDDRRGPSGARERRHPPPRAGLGDRHRRRCGPPGRAPRRRLRPGWRRRRGHPRRRSNGPSGRRRHARRDRRPPLRRPTRAAPARNRPHADGGTLRGRDRRGRADHLAVRARDGQRGGRRADPAGGGHAHARPRTQPGRADRGEHGVGHGRGPRDVRRAVRRRPAHRRRASRRWPRASSRRRSS